MAWTRTPPWAAGEILIVRHLASSAAALLLGVAPPLAAQHPVAAGKVAHGTLSFDGRATTGDFVGTTSTVTGEMTAGATVVEVRGFVEAPVKTLVTGNGRRDKDLNRSMESEQFPTIRFDLSAVQSDSDQGDSVTVTLRGEFTIHGVTRPASLPATVIFDATGVRVRASFPLNLKEYRIGGLSKFLGVLKMNPDITVHVDLSFQGQ
jgi:polyisoprenoid-binding protein YceI